MRLILLLTVSTVESACKILIINYLISRNIRNESLFLNLAHDEEEGNLGRIIERRANFLPRSKMKRIPQKISLEAERIAVPLKSSSLNRNDTPIYIYT